MQDVACNCISTTTPPSGGGLPHRSDRDACRLSLGCKLQILVSLRVFGMRSYYICPFSYCLVLCIKKFTKNVLTLTTQKSPSGVSLSFSHTHIGHPWGFSLNFLLSIPDTFIWESHLPPPRPPGATALPVLVFRLCWHSHYHQWLYISHFKAACENASAWWYYGIAFGVEFSSHFIVEPGGVEEEVWPSGKSARIAIQRPWVHFPLWPLAGLVLSNSESQDLTSNIIIYSYFLLAKHHLPLREVSILQKIEVNHQSTAGNNSRCSF